MSKIKPSKQQVISPDNVREIGETLAKYRKKAKMSQSELSVETGLMQSFISNIESGGRPRVSFVTILQIAHAVKCPVSELGKLSKSVRAVHKPRVSKSA